MEPAGLQRPGRPRRHRRPGFLSAELARRENAVHLRRLRAAVSRSLRPTTLLLGVQPHSDWETLDFELFDALDVLEREISSSNGLPRWLTGSGSPDVDFAVETSFDAAEAALDKWDEDHQGKKKVPGTHRFALPVALADEPIEGGLARERMLLYAMAQDRGEPADDDPSAGLDIDRRRPRDGYDSTEYG